MHRPHSITWTTHTEESATLLEATRLQEALLYTALHYTYMCNIVTEFYLYSIVYIYLINSRLDVTNNVRHHFRTTRILSQYTLHGMYMQVFCNVKLGGNTDDSLTENCIMLKFLKIFYSLADLGGPILSFSPKSARLGGRPHNLNLHIMAQNQHFLHVNLSTMPTTTTISPNG